MSFDSLLLWFSFFVKASWCTTVLITPLKPTNYASLTYNNRTVIVDSDTNSWYMEGRGMTDWPMHLFLPSNVFAFEETYTEINIIMNGTRIGDELDIFYAFSVSDKYFTFLNDFDSGIWVGNTFVGAFIYPSCGSSLISGNASMLWIDNNITNFDQQRIFLAGGNIAQWSVASNVKNGNKWPIYFTFINNPMNNTFTFRARTDNINVECMYASAFDINSDFSMHIAPDLGAVDKCRIYSFNINVSYTQTPTINPSSIPSIPSITTSDPSISPTKLPTNNPSSNPSSNPSRIPSNNPSNNPSSNPSSNPSYKPSKEPSSETLYPLSFPPTNYPNQPSYSAIDPTKTNIQESNSNAIFTNDSAEFVLVFIAVSIICLIIICSVFIFLYLKKRNKKLENYETQVSNVMANANKVPVNSMVNNSINPYSIQTQMAITNFQIMQAMQIHSNQNQIMQQNMNVKSEANMNNTMASAVLETYEVNIDMNVNAGQPKIPEEVDIQSTVMNAGLASTIDDSQSGNSFVSISTTDEESNASGNGCTTRGNTPFVQ